MAERMHVTHKVLEIEIEGKSVDLGIDVSVDLRDLTDDEVQCEVKERGLNIVLVQNSDEAERALDLMHELSRLAEFIAAGETDAALEILHDLVPEEVPSPSGLKRLVAARQAEPARRFA